MLHIPPYVHLNPEFAPTEHYDELIHTIAVPNHIHIRGLHEHIDLAAQLADEEHKPEP